MLWWIIWSICWVLIFMDQEVVKGVANGALIEKTGCLHNGTLFAGGSLVPTMEPCLSCQCNGRTLVCSLRICPEMPVPPPRGCILVQKKNVCCAYLSCSKYHTLYNGPNRRIVAYLDHYERETLDRIVNDNVLYRRSDDSELDGSGEICIQNGTVYKSGSAMSSSSLCSYCYCIGGTQKCVKPKCMLAMEGCKPIFVDSTCCPVRYDCNSKVSGIVKAKNHYRRFGNKHYQRLSQRMQRGRGCIVNSHYYLEGQKMPSDSNKPCDICFCIRGSRKCAPKKCAPALRNCIPVVPKGQCCPASYECGSLKDYDRAYLSRQFDLFSLLFGSGEGGENSTFNSSQLNEQINENGVTPSLISASPTSEKSIFDAIREGLEFIDNNESSVSNVLDELHDDGNITENNETLDEFVDDDSIHDNNENSKVSFFDILLSNTKQANESSNVRKPAPFTTNPTTTNDVHNATSDYEYSQQDENKISESNEDNESINLFDLLVEENMYSSIFDNNTVNSNNTSVTTDRSDIDYSFEEYSGNGPIDLVNIVSTEDSEIGSTPTTTGSTEASTVLENYSTIENFAENYSLIESTKQTDIQSSTIENISENYELETSSTISIISTSTSRNPIEITSTTPTISTTTSITPKEDNNFTVKKETTASITSANISLATVSSITVPAKVNILEEIPINKTHVFINGPEKEELNNQSFSSLKTEVTTNESEILQSEPSKDLLSVLINGLSTIFHEENENVTEHKDVQDSSNKTQLEKNTTSEINNTTNTMIPVTSTEILPIVNNITSSDVEEVLKTPAPLTVEKTAKDNTLNSLKSTEKPIIIKTNPSILEADLNLDYNEPTLPPSLPNLKIIPFLPADAVKADRKQVIYDYYNTKPAGFSLLANGKPETWNVNPATTNPVTTKLEYAHYPSITEKYDSTLYPENYVPFENHKKYGYDDYEYGDFDLPADGNKDKYLEQYIANKYNNPIKKFDSVLTNIDNKNQYVGVIRTDIDGFDFNHQLNRFSPPTKTEGGFVPKEPVRDDGFYYDNFHSSKFIVELTTALPKPNQNVSKQGISTPDPFKDVIKTEPPPDLHSLIEDKEKFLANGVASNFYESPNSIDVLPFDKEIISITTDSNYNYTSEYKDANDIEFENKYNLSNISNSNKTIATVVNVTINNSNLNTTLPILAGSILEKSTDNVTNATVENSHEDQRNEESNDFKGEIKNILSFLFNEDDKSQANIIKNRTNDKILHPEEMFLSRKQTFNKTNNIQQNVPIKAEKENNTALMEDLSFLKDTLLSSSNNDDYTLLSARTTTTVKPPRKDSEITLISIGPTTSTTTPNPFLSEPFNKLPFLNPSFPVKPPNLKPGRFDSAELDLLLTNSNDDIASSSSISSSSSSGSISSSISSSSEKEFHPGGYEIFPNDSTDKYAFSPSNIDKLTHHQSEGVTHVFTKSNNSNSLRDPAGILKLAGCNIYGRMYRVGRIISELSGPCLECKCTEIGVHCTPLDC